MIDSYSYSYYRPKADDGNCGICWDPLANGEVVVAHEEEGAKHPMHRKCARNWSANNNTCPYCSAIVDWFSLYSLKVASPKELAIRELKEIGTDTLVGTLMGTIAGALSGAIVSIGTQYMLEPWIEPTKCGLIVGAFLALDFVNSSILHRRDHPNDYNYKINFND